MNTSSIHEAHMSSLQSVRKVRIFVASPSDMKSERQCVAKVVSRLNEATARQFGMMLEFTDWSTHVRPTMGRPEGVILEQLGVDTWDVFIGLLWLRFGMPTGGDDPVTGARFESGTQEEFDLAYRSWKEKEKPTIMLYRCDRMPTSMRDIDGQQKHKVDEFFKRFEPGKENPGLYQSFEHAEELEGRVYTDLSKVIFEKCKTPPEPPKADNDFKPGDAYEVVAVSADIKSHSQMVKTHGVEKVRPILKWLQQTVLRICAPPQWAKVSWAADGGMFVTKGDRRHDRAAMAGIRLLKEVELYNLEPDHAIKFKIRVAADDGPIVWEQDPGEISASVLNFAKHLEARGTEAGEFSITDTVHRCLHETVRSEFRLRPRFEDKRILGYSSGPPSRDSLQNLVNQTCDELKVLAGLPSKDAMSRVDTAYSLVEEFSRDFPALDERWSPAWIEQIDRWATALLDAEKEYWTTVQAKARAKEASDEHEQWTYVANIVSSKRAGVVVPLAELKIETKRSIGRTAKPSVPLPTLVIASAKNIETITDTRVSEELEKKIRTLIAADDLQEEESLASLLSTEREALITGVSSGTAFGELREPLLNRLWALTDLILIDELQDSRDGVFAALLRNPIARPRYGVLTHILRATKAPTEAFVRSRFTRIGLPFTNADLHVVWRSIVAGVTVPDQLVIALAKIPVEILWRTIASPNIRVASLYAVARRFKSESEDKKKIFFDCIHSRLMREVKTNGREFAYVGKLVSLFFGESLFVQSPYFERLDDLLLSVKRASGSANVAVEFFEKLVERLKQVREDKGNPEACIPAGIGSLPLPVQRHLAAEGRYVESFVLHHDFRIARETERFITIANVDRILHYRTINMELFHALLQKKEFFVRPAAAMVALLHPKCSVEFARANLSRVGQSALRAVANTPDANTVVRQLAKQMIGSR
jgi:hypothetical protein